MRVGFSTNVMSCQPLRQLSFGQTQKQQPKSREEYEKQIAALQNECKVTQMKYEVACMFAAQPQAVDKFIKNTK